MKKIKVIREIVTEKDIKDLKGWTIRKGTKLAVTMEGPVTPKVMLREGEKPYKVIVVRVDNGMGWELCPETAIREYL